MEKNIGLESSKLKDRAKIAAKRPFQGNDAILQGVQNYSKCMEKVGRFDAR